MDNTIKESMKNDSEAYFIENQEACDRYLELFDEKQVAENIIEEETSTNRINTKGLGNNADR